MLFEYCFLLVDDLSLVLLQIGDVDRCTVYVSLAPGMENPAGMDRPEDRVAGKRPIAVDPSPAEALPAETSQAPKRRRLVRITDDEEEEEEAAPSLVQKPHSRPDVAPATTGRVTSDPPAPHAEPTRLGETRAAAATGRTRGGSSQQRTGAPICKFFQSHFCTSSYLCFVLLLWLLTFVKCHNFVSAASDVDPDNVAGQKTAEPAVVVEDAVQQTTQEQSEEQPMVVTVAESAEEHPTPTGTGASTPARDDEAARMPPPSSVAEEEDRAPTPPPAEERRVPTPPRAETSSPKGSPGRDKGPVIPVTTTGGSAEGEETQAASDDEVETIQGEDERDGCSGRAPARSQSATSRQGSGKERPVMHSE